MVRRVFLIALSALVGMAHAQSGLSFEVASVKPSGPQSVRGSHGGPGSSDPGRYSFTSATLQDLIAIAYHVDYFQISSKAPLDRQGFDLVAKLPEGATKQQFREMMQNLLAERFHLKLHKESREFPAYELVVAKSGPKLEAARKAADGDFPELPADRPGMASVQSLSGGYVLVRLRARQESMTEFASFLHSPDDRPIVDKTGLAGKYDFTLEYTLERRSAPAGSEPQLPVAPSLFTAVQQQLGLQLVDKKAPFDVIVVESVDKLPTEN